MRKTLRIVVMMLVWAACVNAQEPLQPVVGQTGTGTPGNEQQRHPADRRARAHQAAAAKKAQQVPSIIQSELDRSRSEEKQLKNVPVRPAEQPASHAPVWPLLVSLGCGTLATGGLLYYFLRRKTRSIASARRAPSAALPHDGAAAAPRMQPAAVSTGSEQPDDRADEPIYDRAVTSASPYVNDDDTEMPEAALTMNLLNKKRETKKEVILEVMKRVQRRENPQHIAEALRIGIGEVHLAMTLAKLKK